MKMLTRTFAAILVFLTSVSHAVAETRIALIVGIGNYSSVTQLDNPVPDADLMGKVLRDKGFDVTILTDVDHQTLNHGISEFGRNLRAAGKDATGLFFYAGHAVQSFGENYLLPVDTELTDAADLSLVAVQAEAVLRQMRSARNKTNIVILDACRNNPFQAIPDLNDNGLAEMNAPTGTFLSYSTAPGAVALDGLDENSPFTKALASEIPEAGVPIEQTFKKVRVQVISETQGQQTPWDTSSLTSDFFFQPIKKLSAQELQERQLWDSVKISDDPVQVMLFLRSYPNGLFHEVARELLTVLMAAELGTGAALTSDKPAVTAAPQVVAIAKPIPEPAPPVEPARKTEPKASEDEMINAAQATATAAGYQAYLDAYPRGIYAELAVFELEILEKRAARAAAAAQPAETAALPAQPAKTADLSALTFTSPFPTGGEPIQGLSIQEIVDLSPLFSPIEGLPEELWKDQNCSHCHEWTQKSLCTLGGSYASASNERALSKEHPHPFGGIFKKGLRAWAAADCR